VSRAGAALLAALLVSAPATARPADPEDYILLIDRYAEACVRLSADECAFAPMTPEKADRLACLFDELERRAGAGTAEAHVAWAETYAETRQPPGTGFPVTIGEQETLVGALIACGRGNAPR
jgi:hypothetical protein